MNKRIVASYIGMVTFAAIVISPIASVQAKTTKPPVVQNQCTAAAEATLQVAIKSENQTFLTARKTAATVLAATIKGTSNPTAIAAAHKAYSTAMKKAMEVWSKSRGASMKQYKTAIKSC